MRHTTGAMTAAGSTASRRPSPHPPSSALVTTSFSHLFSLFTRVVGWPYPFASPSPLLPQEVSRSIPHLFRGPARPPMNIFAVCVGVCVDARRHTNRCRPPFLDPPPPPACVWAGHICACIMYTNITYRRTIPRSIKGVIEICVDTMAQQTSSSQVHASQK